jgi:sugar/nucleoside kinase (ribokinase family)
VLDLISIGNICIDLFLPPHEAPPRGGITYLPSLSVVPGGNGSNTAIAAARLGTRAAVGGVLGDDLFGRHLRDFLLAESVDVSLLTLRAGRQSPATVVLNDATGERSFVHYPGTDADFALPERVLAAPARLVHFAAPELLGSFWPRGCLAAARQLRATGHEISLDTFVPPGSDAVEEHRPLLEVVDLALANEEEARLITGQSEVRDMARYLLDRGVKVAAIKRGERGAVVATRDEYFEVPAERVPVVDTCGAGDNFAGGFLAAYLHGLSLADCGAIGCAMGTRCVQSEGSLTGTADKSFLSLILAQLAKAA